MPTRTITLDESYESEDVVVTAEPLTVELDELELGKGPATAIATAVGKGIAAIASSASPATIRRRRSDGITSTRLFNATGKLAAGIRAAAAGDGYEITAPADRLSEPGMAEQLAELVPAIRDPLGDAGVKAAVEKADALTAKVGRP